AWVMAQQRSMIHLQAGEAKRFQVFSRQFDPIEYRHRPVNTDVIHVALGESGKLQAGFSSTKLSSQWQQATHTRSVCHFDRVTIRGVRAQVLHSVASLSRLAVCNPGF